MGKQMENSQQTVFFGFRSVDATQKASLVRDVFDKVADKYDLMNDIMSMGVHRLWKNGMVDQLAPRHGRHYLDVAGGTGDIALRIKARVPEARVTLCDINARMLSHGRARSLNKGYGQGLDFIVGDAQALAVADQTVDGYTIAFGLRNVTDLDLALKEAYRVLRPGGRFLCLEFSQVSLPLLSQLYEAYSFQLLPSLGAIVAGDAGAYRYLVESIRRFPAQSALAEKLHQAGFAKIRWDNYSGGIAALHSAWRL
jgi:demethylmenaquinone methyltransferase / 2-methoxy-6-polyprenyl-1,4-benzoquinol methylase